MFIFPTLPPSLVGGYTPSITYANDVKIISMTADLDIYSFLASYDQFNNVPIKVSGSICVNYNGNCLISQISSLVFVQSVS